MVSLPSIMQSIILGLMEVRTASKTDLLVPRVAKSMGANPIPGELYVCLGGSDQGLNGLNSVPLGQIMGLQLVGRQRKACFHRRYPCVDNQSDGDPLRGASPKGRKADRRLGKQGLEPSGEEERMTSVTAKPTTTKLTDDDPFDQVHDICWVFVIVL